ncbi:hypothetical protein K470DRAFT_254224 [Piedraia hortae CBS 480.64]|uniref:histone acetyltransferase n=1 Tax=Piedraia hortae CBS 480.64 TaxID=1314780 RepID=A0A6A7CBU6_9PEZI|nr:hypothetical protein K470DRAFT_254224 [Piedraia hortae CBS 480.64]
MEAHFLSLGFGGILALGIEVFIYTTVSVTIVFVSKADSTGFVPVSSPRFSARAVASAFLQWLVMLQDGRRRVVVSLFARAQPQYLFAGSSECEEKHILDDRQLIRWWARVLDSVISANAERRCFMTVPGYSAHELRQFYPLGSTSWQPGYPLVEVLGRDDVPIRCLLPRFPDDPKARFMQDLDDEVGLLEGSPSKKRNGQWANIRSLDQFWTAMEFRQECSSGRMVGFIWVLYTPHLALEATPQPSETDRKSSQKKKMRREPRKGPIIPRQPRVKVPAAEEKGPDHALVLSREKYDKAIQTLLTLDFANAEIATQSTRKWAAEVCTMSGLPEGEDFQAEVEGCAAMEGARDQNNRKRKEVNVLDASMVRKRRKDGN